MENLTLNLRSILDGMVFGMSHIPGFSALSVPVFISNYLFDFFSEFFLILTLFALAIMAFDGLRKGRQSLKEDAINLSLAIITVFTILQFKDKSVTYGDAPAYGIVTIYAGLLEKGEDIADALTYAMLFNSPHNGKYSPGKAIPTADTPLSGIVANSFFSFIVKNGEINNENLESFLKERKKIISGQEEKIQALLKQDDADKVLKNTFNIAKTFYISATALKHPQGYSKIINADKVPLITYSITDGQTATNNCVFFTPLKHLSFDKISNKIDKMISFNYFKYITPGCKINEKLGSYKDLTYPYILSESLKSTAYFWNRIYKNLNAYKSTKLGKTEIGEQKKEYDAYLAKVKYMADFYNQAADMVDSQFPADSFKKYPLIFSEKNIYSSQFLTGLQKALIVIWQKRNDLVEKYGNKNVSVSGSEFFADLNGLMSYYIGAIQATYKSQILFYPKIFFANNGTEDKAPDAFVLAFNTADLVVEPYIVTAGITGTLNAGKNLTTFYNSLINPVYNIYKRINKKTKVDKTEEYVKNNVKEPSLTQLVKKEYGYDSKVDLIFPGKKLPLSANEEEIKKFYKDNAYKNRKISWVDLGYYFSAIKAYTSNFIIFTTYALANNAFTDSGKVNGDAIRKVVNLANQYANAYNKNLSDSAKISEISESVANTLTLINAVKDVKNNIGGMLGSFAAGFASGPVALFLAIGSILLKIIVFGFKTGFTFILAFLGITIILKFITILLPAGFWMVAVLNWFFKSAMMLILLPINVFLMFFKSRRQVFFQALWKLLAQMLTPVALVATFFVVIVFSIEIDFLLNYFIPFLNDNVLVYLLGDENIRNVVNNITHDQFAQAKQLMQAGGVKNFLLGVVQFWKAVGVGMAAKTGGWLVAKMSPLIVKILGIVLLLIKTIIIFVIDIHLYMLFFRADDYIREVLGEVFGATTGFDSSMERIMGKFGVNKIS
jgi:hypothetical protein